MPRLPTSLLRRARAQDPLLLPLLRTCRDLESARNELRWLRENVEAKVVRNKASRGDVAMRKHLRKDCLERGRGRPLQYILGTEYFGELELLCRPGVLIPRPETADSILHLVSRLGHATGLQHGQRSLRVLDLCTGSGCMTLLLHHELHKAFKDLSSELLGLDISPKALRLSRDNLKHVGTISRKSKVYFERANVLASPSGTSSKIPSIYNVVEEMQGFDILVANPPYISTQQFYRATARSVRAFEPRLALVPGPTAVNGSDAHECLPKMLPQDSSVSLDDGDVFYPHIAEIAETVGAKLVLLEVGDSAQAERVAKLLASRVIIVDGVSQPAWHAIEIWRDGVATDGAATRSMLQCGTFGVPVIGPEEATHGRTVVCWRAEANSWLTTASRVDGFAMKSNGLSNAPPAG